MDVIDLFNDQIARTEAGCIYKFQVLILVPKRLFYTVLKEFNVRAEQFAKQELLDWQSYSIPVKVTDVPIPDARLRGTYRGIGFSVVIAETTEVVMVSTILLK